MSTDRLGQDAGWRKGWAGPTLSAAAGAVDRPAPCAVPSSTAALGLGKQSFREVVSPRVGMPETAGHVLPSHMAPAWAVHTRGQPFIRPNFLTPNAMRGVPEARGGKHVALLQARPPS